MHCLSFITKECSLNLFITYMLDDKSQYLIENDQDPQWGITVSNVGKQETLQGQQYPHGHHPYGYLFSQSRGRVLLEYQLLYIVRGQGTFVSAHCTRQKVKSGDMIMLFPGEWHCYYPDKDVGWTEMWIGFKGSNIDARVSSGFFSVDKPIFKVGLLEGVVGAYKHAIEVAQNQYSGYQQMLAGITNLLLGYAYYYNVTNSVEDKATFEAIQRSRIYMNDHFNKGVKPEEVADFVNMGYSRFRRLFKEYTGYSPLQYMLELRLKRCCELLTTTNMNMSEIAYSMGYDSVDYFSNAFKRKYNLSTQQYRKLSRG